MGRCVNASPDLPGVFKRRGGDCEGRRVYDGARILIESAFPRVADLIGGIDAWLCLVDTSIPRYRDGR